MIPKIEIHRQVNKDDVTRALRDRKFTLAQITGVEGLSDFSKFS